MQKVFMQLGLQRARAWRSSPPTVRYWAAGIAAQLSRLSITWLHPLGSLDDQLFQIEDSEAEMLVIDADTFRDRGGDLAARASGLKHVFTLGPTNYGVDLLAAADDAGTAVALSGRPDDIATLNYTGERPGNPKARCALIASMAASPTRRSPTSKSPTHRAISRSHRSAMSPAPRCCPRLCSAAPCTC